jgi:hypothetical protein
MMLCSMSVATPQSVHCSDDKAGPYQCVKGRIHYAVFNAGCNVRGDTALSFLYDWKSSTVYRWWVMMKECDTVLDMMKPRWTKFAMWN